MICPILLGDHGTGKNTISDVLAELYGSFANKNVL